MFSVLVVTSGTVFLLILLPVTFIQSFYAPWLTLIGDRAAEPRFLERYGRSRRRTAYNASP